MTKRSVSHEANVVNDRLADGTPGDSYTDEPGVGGGWRRGLGIGQIADHGKNLIANK